MSQKSKYPSERKNLTQQLNHYRWLESQVFVTRLPLELCQKWSDFGSVKTKMTYCTLLSMQSLLLDIFGPILIESFSLEETKIEEVLGNWSSLIDIWHTLISRIFENWLSCNLKCVFQQNKLINTLFQIQKTCQNAMLNSILLKYVYYIGTQPIFKKLVKSMSVICLLDSINCLRLPLSLSGFFKWQLIFFC